MCTCCGEMKVNESEFSTGYGVDNSGFKVCFECCGKNDRLHLINMKQGEKVVFYFSKGQITNWPSTLKITPSHIRKGRHNFCGTKTSFWFQLEGQKFYGYQIGDFNELAHIRKIK